MPLTNTQLLFDALLACARNLETLHTGLATANGTTTTLVDSTLTALGYDQDDLFNGGTIFFMAAPAGAPLMEDMSRFVSDYAQSTGTITFSPSISTATTINHKYGLMTGRYPRQVMIDKINKVLHEQDILSSTTITADGGREYTLPTIAAPSMNRGGRIHSIRVGASSETPDQWTTYLKWRYDVASNLLLFENDIPNGYSIRVYFWGQHLNLENDSDILNTDLNSDWIGMAAAAECVRWHLSQPGADERASTALLNDLSVRLQTLRQARHYGWRPSSTTIVYGTFWPEG